MPAATDPDSLTQAAEEAASAGDYVSAEQQLRLAVEAQEASIGAQHPDVANTLNNLGVVYERLDRPADAERCYRRAFSIASTVLAPDHPFVTLSATNLRDFCLARGIPFEGVAASVPAPTSPPPTPALPPEPAPAVVTDIADPATRVSTSRPPAAHSRRGLILAAAVALVLVVLVVVATRSPSSAPSGATEGTPTSAPSSAAGAPTPTEGTPAPVARNAPSSAPSGATEGKPTSTAGAATEGRPVAPDAPPAAAGTLSVVSAELCRSLETGSGEWQCTPASGVLQPGTLFYYTRVASPANATIEHRWYRNDSLHQTVPLRVRANPREGFRTYSRMTVNAERAGDWRVEVRARSGEVLREERFTVSP